MDEIDLRRVVVVLACQACTLEAGVRFPHSAFFDWLAERRSERLLTALRVQKLQPGSTPGPVFMPSKFIRLNTSLVRKG